MQKNKGCREENGDEEGWDEMQLISKWCRMLTVGTHSYGWEDSSVSEAWHA